LRKGDIMNGGMGGMLSTFFGSSTGLATAATSSDFTVFGPYGSEEGDLDVVSQSTVDKLLSIASGAATSFNSILQSIRGGTILTATQQQNATKAAQQSTVMTGGSVALWLALAAGAVLLLFFAVRK
jgi:hypothetical protein